MHVVEKEFKDFVEKIDHVNNFYVAYSGGVDSQVLLYLSNKYIKENTTALHVNHGISDNASNWEGFCEDTANQYDLKIKKAKFQLKDEKSNLEEKARELRYNFFEENIQENDYLMTGHHLDDQAETFMLRLMRGAGVDGLSSMEPKRVFNKGFLIRPLLNVSKEEIKEFAMLVGLKWVEDESNTDTHYDRNFIRNEVMPLLKTRWKNANKSIAKSVSLCRESKNGYEIIAEKELDRVSLNENEILTDEFLKLDENTKKLVLRKWYKNKNLKMLDTKTLNVLINEVFSAKKGSKACFKGVHYTIRKGIDTVCFIENNSDFDFEVNKKDFKISKDQDQRMYYKGMLKKIKVILREENVNYWERDSYPVYLKDGIVLAVGNILSDHKSDIIVKKVYLKK